MINPLFSGDLSRSLSLRMTTLSAKRQLDLLSQELSSGIKSDIAKSLNGDLSPMTAVETRMKSIKGYQVNTNSLALKLDTIQTVLSSISADTNDLSTTLISAAGKGSAYELKTAIMTGSDVFTSLIATLNTTIEGKSLLAGSESNSPPLKPATDIINDVLGLLPPFPSGNDIIDIVEQIFAEPLETSHFYSSIYQGSTTGKLTTLIDENRLVTINATVLDRGIRDAIKGTLLLAVHNQVSDYISNGDTQAISEKSGEILLSAGLPLITLRTEIGILQQAAERQRTSLGVELGSLEKSLSDLASIDPYDTSMELLDAEARMKNIYTISSRLSKLSLLDYLR